jgi:hypothetical protein
MEKSSIRKFVIHQIPDRLAVVRMKPGSEVPSWAWTGPLSAVVRTADELTIVCDQTVVPGDLQSERDWVALMIEGPLPFAMTGVLYSLLEPLASSRISAFIVSTFDTDCVLVKATQAQQAKGILESEGHEIR